MNLHLLKIITLIFVVTACSDKNTTTALYGTWQLSTYQYGPSSEKSMPENIKRIKLITPGHFTWIQYDTQNNIVTNSAGGTTTFDGTNYIESIDFAQMGMSNYLKKRQIFILKFENGKMYLEGQLSDSLKIKEVWLKLE